MVKTYKKRAKCLVCPVDYDHSQSSYVLTCISEDGELLNFLVDDFIASRLICRNSLYHYFSNYCIVSYYDVYGLELDNIYLVDNIYLPDSELHAIL